MKSRHALTAAFAGLVLVTLAGCGTENSLAPGGDSLDTTPPSIPSNVQAKQFAGDLVLSWDASSDADVAGYDVYRYSPDPSRDNAYVKVNGSLITGTEYPVADASVGGDWYRVKSVDRSANTSAGSTAVEGAKAAWTGGSAGDQPVAEPGIMNRSPRP